MISWRATGTVVTGTGTTLSPVVPANARVGDLLILTVAVDTAIAQTFTGLSSWTLQKNLSVNIPVLAVFTKRCVAGDIGATIAPAWGTSAPAVSGIVVYTGVDTTTPIDTSSSGNASGTATIQYGSVVAPLNNMILAIASQDAVASVGTPSGFTSRINNTVFMTLGFAEKAVTAGSTGAVTSSAGNTNGSEGCLLALRPAQVPTFRAGTSISLSSNTSKAIPQPVSTQIGDLIICQFEFSANPGTVTPPGGVSTHLAPTLMSGLGSYIAIYSYIATTAGAATVTFTWVNASNGGISVTAWVGAGSVDAIGTLGTGSGSTILTYPSATTTNAEDLLLAMSWTNNAVSVGPVGSILGFNAGAWNNHYVYIESNQAASATGTRVGTTSAADNGQGILLAIKPPANAPKVRGTAKNQVTIGTSVSATLPVNQTNGDVAVVSVAWSTNPGAITPPAGWTEIESDLTGTNGQWLKVYTKTTGTSEAAPTITWATGATATTIATLTVGGGTVDVDGHTITATGGSFTNWPSVTTTGTPRLILFIGHEDGSNSNSVTTPLGSAQILVDGTGAVGNAGYEVQSAAGATGARTGTLGSTGDVTGYVIAISGNQPPNTPTSLQRTDATQTVNTPSFSAAMSDPDTGQQVKVRFEVWNRAHTVMSGSVDSALATSPGTVSATYSSALPVGQYSVKAFAIDAAGASSGYTAFVDFDVTQSVSKDETLLWNVTGSVQKDTVLLWDVRANNLKDVSLLWNVFIAAPPKNITLLWTVDPVWTNVPYETTPPTWQEVVP